MTACKEGSPGPVRGLLPNLLSWGLLYRPGAAWLGPGRDSLGLRPGRLTRRAAAKRIRVSGAAAGGGGPSEGCGAKTKQDRDGLVCHLVWSYRDSYKIKDLGQIGWLAA